MPEFRKLIGFGKSSLVVSLPKDWVVKNHLKKGDVIPVDEAAYQRQLTTQYKPIEAQERTAQIRTENKAFEKIKSEIVAAYLSGHNVIEVRGENLKEHAQKVKEVLQNFAGIELLEQDSRKIVAKDLLDLSEISIDTIIRRVDIILRSMFQDSIGQENTESIYSRDKDINRLVWLVRRVVRLALDDHRIAKKLHATNLQLLNQHELVRWMELAGDQIKRVNRLFDELPAKYKYREELTDMFRKIEMAYLESMKAYHTKNIERAFELNISHEQMMNDLRKLTQSHTVYPASRIVQKLINLSHDIKNVARVAIC